MKKLYTIGEAAQIVSKTSETLRHYDRIGLVHPSKKEEWTKYRYYSDEDLVRLNTIKALQMMDLPLSLIKQVLEYDDLEKIVALLSQPEKKADEKIASLTQSKAKIQLAKKDYEKKLQEKQNINGTFIQSFPQRVILLSDTLQTPTIDNLWNYLQHFYEKIKLDLKSKFTFEDLAGIYTENNQSRLFALCKDYVMIDGLKILPKGNYLCANCMDKNKEQTINDLINLAQTKYQINPQFVVQIIVISGILQWNYQIQIFLGN